MGHWTCPHKSPFPCNTCHTHVIIQICVLINMHRCSRTLSHTHTHTHTHLHTHLHTHTHTHTHTHIHSLIIAYYCLELHRPIDMAKIVFVFCIFLTERLIRADIKMIRHTTFDINKKTKCFLLLTVFYNHFCTNNITFVSFFKTLDTKLKTVIICNTGRPMFKTLHIAFISLKKPCICRSIGSKY